MRVKIVRFIPVLLAVALTGAASRSLAAICDGVSPAPSTTLTAVRVASGSCTNDQKIPCINNTTCRFCNNDHTIPCTVASNCVIVGGGCGLPGTCMVVKPTQITAPPGDTNRIFIVDQDGRIWIRRDGVMLTTPFLDIDAITQSTNNEEGLLTLAFSPSYATDGYFFVFHTENGGNTNTLARYSVSVDPDQADPTSRTVVLPIAHPTNANHNGGGMAFGVDDGYLYLGVGDGGSGCDPPNNAQNTSELKGKMLRLDVIPAPVPPASPYRIPPDNPFVGPGPPLDEIWSLGLRNPWRFSFDRQNADLYIGDVGQNNFEEIDYRTTASAGGENYGWNHYEGLACPPPVCGGACAAIVPRVDPVKTYSIAGNPCAVTGGYVYRGCRMPSLAAQSRYFYADYCAATIDSFVMSHEVVTDERSHTAELGTVAFEFITSFGEDGRGEIYFTKRGSSTASPGGIFKIVPILNNLEVSGMGAAPFRLGANWTWEDLALTSDHPINLYRVYRHEGNGSGTFTCVFKTPTVTPPARPAAVWPGGDPSTPSPGNLYSYVVTAVRLSPAEESSPGTRSDGAPRILSPAPCP